MSDQEETEKNGFSDVIPDSSPTPPSRQGINSNSVENNDEQNVSLPKNSETGGSGGGDEASRGLRGGRREDGMTRRNSFSAPSLKQLSSERSINSSRGGLKRASSMRMDQMELDALSKSLARSSRGPLITRVSNEKSPPKGPGMLARQSSDYSTASSRGSKRHLFVRVLGQMEQDVIDKTRAMQPSRQSSHYSLTDMEEDVLAKSLSGDSKPERRDSLSSTQSRLKLSRKSSDYSIGSSTRSLTIKNANPITRRLSNQSWRSQSSLTLGQLEEDVEIKTLAARPPGPNTTVIVPSSHADDPADLDITFEGRDRQDDLNDHNNTRPGLLRRSPSAPINSFDSTHDDPNRPVSIRSMVQRGLLVRRHSALGPIPIPPPQNFAHTIAPTSHDPISEEEEHIDVPDMDGELPAFDAFVAEPFLENTVQGETFNSNTIVAAQHVAVLRDDEEYGKLPSAKGRNLLLLTICVAILTIAIAVSFVAFRPDPPPINGSTASPTPFPSLMPSMPPTSPPTTDSFDVAARLLIERQVSSLESIQTPGTPQNVALHWIANEDQLRRPVDHARFIQRYVLAVWYFSSNGEGWEECARSLSTPCSSQVRFLDPTDECLWFSVACEDGQVVKVSIARLTGYNIKGTIPEELCHLPELTDFRMPHNKLTGTLPWCWGTSLRSMQKLDVSNNSLQSPLPPSILDLPLLTQLRIAVNNFQEDFPDLSRLPRLHDFQAQSNNFTGSISAGIGNLQDLGTFQVHDNSIAGTLPSDFASLSPSLEFLTLSNNRLEGTFPSEIFNKTNLRWLWISNNSFVGTIPPHSGNFGLNNARRKLIWLDGNLFNGTIPSEMANIALLNELRLNNNNFVGDVPTSLCATRGNTFNSLSVLDADCATVKCECCSNC